MSSANPGSSEYRTGLSGNVISYCPGRFRQLLRRSPAPQNHCGGRHPPQLLLLIWLISHYCSVWVILRRLEPSGAIATNWAWAAGGHNGIPSPSHNPVMR